MINAYAYAGLCACDCDVLSFLSLIGTCSEESKVGCRWASWRQRSASGSESALERQRFPSMTESRFWHPPQNHSQLLELALPKNQNFHDPQSWRCRRQTFHGPQLWHCRRIYLRCPELGLLKNQQISGPINSKTGLQAQMPRVRQQSRGTRNGGMFQTFRRAGTPAKAQRIRAEM